MSGATVASPGSGVPMPATVLDPDFDARWRAWQLRGLEAERVTRARLRMAVPVFAACVAGALYLMMSR